ncbi:hypothetical protein DN757_00060 [Paenibacillus silvae]|uniref:Uncharacterized protein n=2 Tax=Paenibacillus silvae TaxID=1325358 RepID=A0A2W6PHV8_9BACL|nr:hypothetical protein DN757_00060 [Paenibacillus silvae]
MCDMNLWDTLKPLLLPDVQFEEQDQLESDETFERHTRQESFEEYIDRVGHLIPHVPHNVLEHWIYRHYDFILDEYIQLGMENLRFVKESWSSDKIYNDIRLFNGEEPGGMGYHIYENEDDMEDWLTDYILEHRTWPEPIIILNNLKFNS